MERGRGRTASLRRGGGQARQADIGRWALSGPRCIPGGAGRARRKALTSGEMAVVHEAGPSTLGCRREG